MSQKLGIFEGISYCENSILEVCIDHESLGLVFEYYTVIDRDNDKNDIPKPLPYSASFVIDFGRALGDKLHRHAEWIDCVASKNKNRIQLWKLFEAANYLHAQKLLDLCSARIAFEFKFSKIDTLRSELKIETNDFVGKAK